MLGNSLKNTTNVTLNLTVGQTYQFPFMKNETSGQSVFLIAYPANQNAYQNTSFSFNYTLASQLYPVDGGNYILEKYVNGE